MDVGVKLLETVFIIEGTKIEHLRGEPSWSLLYSLFLSGKGRSGTKSSQIVLVWVLL